MIRYKQDMKRDMIRRNANTAPNTYHLIHCQMKHAIFKILISPPMYRQYIADLLIYI